MEFKNNESKILKGVGIIFLLFLHLFNTKTTGVMKPILFINDIPLVYYLSLVAGCCVPLFLFLSGYGISIKYEKNLLNKKYIKEKLKNIMINYWIIVIMFVLVGFLCANQNYPGSLKEFFLNMVLLSKSYNGAWWFLQTYIILIIFSRHINNLIYTKNNIIILGTSGFIYLVFFVESLYKITGIGNENILYTLILNLGLCQFSYILGVLFYKNKIISKIRKNKKSNLKGSILLIVSIIINVTVENYIVDPLTAVLIVLAIALFNVNRHIEKVLIFLSKHSTNIWLTHMFFYKIFFKDLIYFPKEPILILIWLFIVCILTSYVIIFINKNIFKMLKFQKNKKYQGV